jgi:iron complex outermembrane receptor protein
MRKYALICIAAMNTIAATAAEAEYADTISLSNVEVSAPYKTSITLTPLTVTTVRASTIEKSVESSLLPVLQNQVPGLFVSERGFAGYGVSDGAAGTVSIRGIGQGNKVLFMIDGQPQWAGVFGHALPDTYVANGVERVEVVRGPSSLLYGSNAMGGSVNIITRRATEDGVTGRGQAMFGSFNTQKCRTGVSYRKGRFGATASGQLDRSNGNRSGSDFWLANEYVQMSYTVDDRWQVGSTVTMTQSKAYNPGTLQNPLEGMWTDISRGTASVYAHNNHGISNGGVQAYINWGAHTIDDGWTPGDTPTDYLFHSHDYNMGITTFQTIHPWHANDLSVGVDFVHWGGSTWDAPKGNPDTHTSDFKAHENEVAGYVMMQQGFFANRLNINAGIRLQHSSQYGNVWVPQAGFIVKPLTDSSIKFSWGKGFRAPNLRELYLYMPRNPDLRPEHLWSYEVELRKKLLNSRLDMGISFYFIDGKDMIQTQSINGRPLNVNVGRFINKGFEIDCSYIINRQWNLVANYSYLHTDTAVLYAPKNKLFAQMNYTPGQWTFTAEAISVGGLLSDNTHTSDYAMINAKVAYKLTAKNAPVTLFAKFDNINNKHYEVIYGCPMPGFTMMGGVDFKF